MAGGQSSFQDQISPCNNMSTVQGVFPWANMPASQLPHTYRLNWPSSSKDTFKPAAALIIQNKDELAHASLVVFEWSREDVF